MKTIVIIFLVICLNIKKLHKEWSSKNHTLVKIIILMNQNNQLIPDG